MPDSPPTVPQPLRPPSYEWEETPFGSMPAEPTGDPWLEAGRAMTTALQARGTETFAPLAPGFERLATSVPVRGAGGIVGGLFDVLNTEFRIYSQVGEEALKHLYPMTTDEDASAFTREGFGESYKRILRASLYRPSEMTAASGEQFLTNMFTDPQSAMMGPDGRPIPGTGGQRKGNIWTALGGAAIDMARGGATQMLGVGNPKGTPTLRMPTGETKALNAAGQTLRGKLLAKGAIFGPQEAEQYTRTVLSRMEKRRPGKYTTGWGMYAKPGVFIGPEIPITGGAAKTTARVYEAGMNSALDRLYPPEHRIAQTAAGDIRTANAAVIPSLERYTKPMFAEYEAAQKASNLPPTTTLGVPDYLKEIGTRVKARVEKEMSLLEKKMLLAEHEQFKTYAKAYKDLLDHGVQLGYAKQVFVDLVNEAIHAIEGSARALLYDSMLPPRAKAVVTMARAKRAQQLAFENWINPVKTAQFGSMSEQMADEVQRFLIDAGEVLKALPHAQGSKERMALLSPLTKEMPKAVKKGPVGKMLKQALPAVKAMESLVPEKGPRAFGSTVYLNPVAKTLEKRIVAKETKAYTRILNSLESQLQAIKNSIPAFEYLHFTTTPEFRAYATDSLGPVFKGAAAGFNDEMAAQLQKTLGRYQISEINSPEFMDLHYPGFRQKYGVNAKVFSDNPTVYQAARDFQHIKTTTTAELYRNYLPFGRREDVAPEGWVRWPEIDDVYPSYKLKFDPRLIEYANKIFTPAVKLNDEAGKLAKTWWAMTRWFQAITLDVVPATAVRNFFSQSQLMLHDWPSNADWLNAIQLRFGKRITPMDMGKWGKISPEIVRQRLTENGIMGQTMGGGMESLGVLSDPIESQLAMLKTHGAPSAFMGQPVTPGGTMSRIAQSFSNVAGSGNPWVRTLKAGRQWTEDWPRIAYCLKKVREGNTWQEAASLTRMMHGDPHALIPFGASAVRTIFLFPHWQIFNFKKQFTDTMKFPGRFTALYRVYDNLSNTMDPKSLPWKPEYWLWAGGIPTKTDVKTGIVTMIFLGGGGWVPMFDLFLLNLLSNPSQIAPWLTRQVNPFISMPLDAITGGRFSSPGFNRTVEGPQRFLQTPVTPEGILVKDQPWLSIVGALQKRIRLIYTLQNMTAQYNEPPEMNERRRFRYPAAGINKWGYATPKLNMFRNLVKMKAQDALNENEERSTFSVLPEQLTTALTGFRLSAWDPEREKYFAGAHLKMTYTGRKGEAYDALVENFNDAIRHRDWPKANATMDAIFELIGEPLTNFKRQ